MQQDMFVYYFNTINNQFGNGSYKTKVIDLIFMRGHLKIIFMLHLNHKKVFCTKKCRCELEICFHLVAIGLRSVKKSMVLIYT